MEYALTEKEELFMVVDGGRSYTVADIEMLPAGERAELIDGRMFVMESPSTTHQRILGELYMQIRLYIEQNGGMCEVFLAPFAVYITDDIYNYVEPDITVICESDRLDEKGCHGAPDWLIEIVSPSNRYMDYVRKLALYHESGVREYWIVDSERSCITVYGMEHQDGPEEYSFSERVKVGIYEDLYIDLQGFV